MYIGAERDPPVPIGVPTLCRMAFDGADIAPMWSLLFRRIVANPSDAAALLDLSTIAQIRGQHHEHMALQTAALALSRVYRRPPDDTVSKTIRLLALLAPTSAMARSAFMINTPLEFLLEKSNITLDLMYVAADDTALDLPKHDVVFIAADETEENQPVLRKIAELVRMWPNPILNAPERIACLTRSGAWQLLNSSPGLLIPKSARADRLQLARIAGGETQINSVLGHSGYPIIIRPSWSHAGNGLVRLDDAGAMESYLRAHLDMEFYISPFVDYRSSDGFYRKYRIALIDGYPFAVHMAISLNWMIHYVTADMKSDLEKRNEEARFMATFDVDFATRHADAFAAIAKRSGLDYLIVDCSETPDGRLLVFEIGTGMIVHAMDSPDLFPYKRLQMEKLFVAFQRMISAAAMRAAGKSRHETNRLQANV